MKIYLDVSCLNRPFDDQEQARIRLEAAAVGMIFERFDEGAWTQVSSEMATIEIDASPDLKRRARVRLLLPDLEHIVKLTPAVFARGAELQKLGLKAADAVHVAAAEKAEADVLLTCDDRLLRVAQRHAGKLGLPVRNPMNWLEEVEHATDAS